MNVRFTAMILAPTLPLIGWHGVGDATSLPGGPSDPPSPAVRVMEEADAVIREEDAPVERVEGVVEGVVRVDAAQVDPPPMFSPYSRRRHRPPAASSGGSTTAENVIVFVVADEPEAAGPALEAPRSRPTARITQRDRTIIPHVAAVRVGTRIHFPNEDDVFHNLFSLSDPAPFNLGRYPPGDSRTETFDRPGVVRMFCDIHSEMTGVIRVLDTPYFTRPDSDGRFRLSGIPDGTRTIVAWHDQLGADTTQVAVSPSSTARADFQLPR